MLAYSIFSAWNFQLCTIPLLGPRFFLFCGSRPGCSPQRLFLLRLIAKRPPVSQALTLYPRLMGISPGLMDPGGEDKPPLGAGALVLVLN